MNNFDSGGGTQNIAQGENAIGKQVNINQQITGHNNIVSATGDIHIHQPPPLVIPRQLPPLDACFLGRDRQLAELLEQLQPGKVVAVCGPGGMGKSALAAQAVSRLEAGRFPDGIIFHSFYGKPKTETALQEICSAFQIKPEPTLEIAVRQVLAGRKALLILDGAEQADDLKAVLALRSTCGVLITSRKRTDAQGFRLDLKQLEEQPAAAVFCEHSGAAADDPSVAGICKILDGWPVALRIAGRYISSTGESAADYLRWLKEEPFEELGDGMHQEENAALLLRRSMDAVSADARLALGLAGTLAFASIAYEPVTAILDEDERRARKALGLLVNYGLLLPTDGRWQISHALIHTYARTELALSKENLEWLTRWYIAFCHLASKFGRYGYALLNAERAHCLRLMESCLASKLWQEVKLLVRAIDIYLERQGWWTEELAALEMRLTAAQQAGDRRDEGLCLNDLGYTCERRGELDKALSWYEQSLPIYRELRERKEEGITLNNIAAIYCAQANYELAVATYEQSLSIARKVGDREGEGRTMNNIAGVYYTQGDSEQALICYKQCLHIWRELSHKIGQGTTLNNIAVIYCDQGKYRKAMDCRKRDLAIQREVGDRAGETGACWNIGATYYSMGDLAQAEEHIALAVQIAEQISHPSLEQFRDGLARVRVARQGQ